MDLSQKLSNIRQQIDSVEVDIKNNVNDNQAELLEYSKLFSKLKDYNFVDLSSQLSTKLNLWAVTLSYDITNELVLV